MALLQLYQLSEFLICIGVNENIIGRIAFVIITFLPPLGHYLVVQVTKWKYKDYLIGFAFGLFFAIYYAVVPESVELVDCNPLYAIYQYPLDFAYGIYYYTVIFYAICLLVYHIIAKKDIIKRSSALILIGYLSFLVPMLLMILIDWRFTDLVESVMCKYAILLAVTLLIFSFSYPKETSKGTNNHEFASSSKSQ